MTAEQIKTVEHEDVMSKVIIHSFEVLSHNGNTINEYTVVCDLYKEDGTGVVYWYDIDNDSSEEEVYRSHEEAINAALKTAKQLHDNYTNEE